MRIKNYEDLTGHGNIRGRKIIADIIDAGLMATNPYSNTLKLVSVRDNKLIFDRKEMEPGGDPRTGPSVFDLDTVDRIYVFAVGKGMLYIVKALEEVLGDHLTGGLAVCKHGDDVVTTKIEVLSGRHPVPDEAGITGCRRMLEMIASLNLTERDLCITAMGQGCSALACLPDEGISIKDVSAMNQLCLIDNGMPTGDVSYIRNQIDLFRGGRVIRAMRPAKLVNIIGIGPEPLINPGTKIYKTDYETLMRNNLWLPNIPDMTTAGETIEIAERWRVFDKLPASIREKLIRAAKEENTTVSYEEYESYGARLFGVMPAALFPINAAREKAEELGLRAYTLSSSTGTEAGPTGTYVGRLARYHATAKDSPFIKPCVLLAEGEMVVTVNNEKGIGGTNQEFCTAAAIALDGCKRVVIGAVDTDGTDGPGGDFHPDAKARGIRCLSGGLVDGYTAGAAKKKGIDLFNAIKTHGTSGPLWELGSGIAAVQDISLSDLHAILLMDEDG